MPLSIPDQIRGIDLHLHLGKPGIALCIHYANSGIALHIRYAHSSIALRILSTALRTPHIALRIRHAKSRAEPRVAASRQAEEVRREKEAESRALSLRQQAKLMWDPAPKEESSGGSSVVSQLQVNAAA